MMDWDICPQRVAGLEIREAPDGFVVYQPDRDRLHYLNPTAAMLFESCDGRIRAAELPALLAAAYQMNEPPVDEVEQCLTKLLEEGLLSQGAAHL
jgi:Coenzyme PQQ synthesis protein D (PqqD)